MFNMLKKKSVDANSPGSAKVLPASNINSKLIPSKKDKGDKADKEKDAPVTPTSSSNTRPGSSASTASAKAPEPKLTGTREDLNGLLLVRVTAARNCLFPSTANIPADKDEKHMPYCLLEFDKNQTSVIARDVSNVVNAGTSLEWKHRAHLFVICFGLIIVM
jgi:hypothetical protein